jgi:hypothetical protein
MVNKKYQSVFHGREISNKEHNQQPDIKFSNESLNLGHEAGALFQKLLLPMRRLPSMADEGDPDDG